MDGLTGVCVGCGLSVWYKPKLRGWVSAMGRWHICNEPTKACPRCREHLPLSAEFWYRARGGWDSWCKACRREYQQARYRQARDARMGAGVAGAGPSIPAPGQA